MNLGNNKQDQSEKNRNEEKLALPLQRYEG